MMSLKDLMSLNRVQTLKIRVFPGLSKPHVHMGMPNVRKGYPETRMQREYVVLTLCTPIVLSANP